MRERWLDALVAGRAYIGLGLTEPGAGSDVTAITTTATAADGGGGDRLRGGKTSVTMLEHLDAIIVVARTLRDGVDVGVSAFLLPIDSPGVARSRIVDPGGRPLCSAIIIARELFGRDFVPYGR